MVNPGGGVRWRRPRERAGGLLVLAVLLAAGGAIASKAKWPLWVLAGLVTIVAVGLVILDQLRARAKRMDEQTVLLMRHARGTADTGQLPLVRDVPLDQLGVHRAVVQVGYIERDKQQDAIDALVTGVPLLILGHSMAGKTRMAAETVRRRYRDWPMFVADSSTALTDLAGKGGIPDGTVVWLNELDEFLTARGLTVGLLDQLLSSGNRIVATMRAAAFAQFQPTDQLRPVGSDVLQRFEKVWLDLGLTDHERGLVVEQVPDPRIRAAVERYGLAEYVGGGPLAVDRFKTGSSQQPFAVACVRAAADWRRAGLTSNVSQPVLTSLISHYLPPHRRNDLTQPHAIDTALKWAGERINETVALLYHHDDGWRVFDFLLDQLTTENLPIPDATWKAVTEHARGAPDEAGMVSATASVVHQRNDLAETFSRIAAEVGDTGHMAFLGALLAVRGEIAEAEQWWRRAAGAGDILAMRILGALLNERGNTAEAEQWWRRAANASDTQAMNNLGALLHKRGDTAEAEQWWRRAAEADHIDATYNLGALLHKRGDTAEAEQWWRHAADAGDTQAMNNLGALLHKRGDTAEAEQWWRRAAEADHIDATYNLGALLYKRGDTAEAEQWWRRAAEAGDLRAMNVLSALLNERGDTGEAERWWRKAAEAGDTQAMNNLGALLHKRGDTAEAEQWWRHAADAGNA